MHICCWASGLFLLWNYSLRIKLLWPFMYRFLCEYNFYFSGINAKNRIWGTYGSCTFRSVWKGLAVFKRGCTACQPALHRLSVISFPTASPASGGAVIFVLAMLLRYGDSSPSFDLRFSRWCQWCWASLCDIYHLCPLRWNVGLRYLTTDAPCVHLVGLVIKWHRTD